jgi:hypothetical protein
MQTAHKARACCTKARKQADNLSVWAPNDHQKEQIMSNIQFVKIYKPDVTDEEALRLYADYSMYSDAGHCHFDALEFAGIAMNKNPAVRFVRKYLPHCSEQDALEKFRIYLSYREEGQSAAVSRQYAGLL